MKRQGSAKYNVGLKSKVCIIVKCGLSFLVLDKLNRANRFPGSLLLYSSGFTKDNITVFSFSALISPGNSLYSTF